MSPGTSFVEFFITTGFNLTVETVSRCGTQVGLPLTPQKNSVMLGAVAAAPG